MVEENAAASSRSASGRDTFLFPVLPIGGPVEELERAAESKLRTYASLGEQANADRLREALSLARAKLLEVISAPRTTPGS